MGSFWDCRLWNSIGVLCLLLSMSVRTVANLGTVSRDGTQCVLEIVSPPVPEQGPGLCVIVERRRADLAEYLRLGYRTIGQPRVVPTDSGTQSAQGSLLPALTAVSYSATGDKVGEWVVPRHYGIVVHRGDSTVLLMPLYADGKRCGHGAGRIRVELDAGVCGSPGGPLVQMTYHTTLLERILSQSR